MSRPINKTFWKSFSLIVSLLVTFVGIGLVANKQLYNKKAGTLPSLYVRTDKSYVPLGDSYSLLVLSDYKKFIGFTGNLDIGQSCDASGDYCSKISQWKDFDGKPIFVNNGSVTINVPANITPFTVVNFRVRPYQSTTYKWSNPITIGNGQTSGLMDTKSYYLMNNGEVTFTGVNNTGDSPVSFKTVLGFYDKNDCEGKPGKVFYSMKDKKEGWWNPKTPWLTDNYNGNDNYSKQDHQWFISLWKKNSNWPYELLTAQGHEVYGFVPQIVLTFSNGFKTKINRVRYFSQNSSLPNYFLTARYVSNGWGNGNNQAYGISDTSITKVCDIQGSSSPELNQWSVHADKITNFPGYPDVLRLKYYEGELGFNKDSSKYGLREDWFFAKNVGLVRIDTKNFCPIRSGWKTYDKCKPCMADSGDCLTDGIMSKPHVTLKRQ